MSEFEVGCEFGGSLFDDIGNQAADLDAINEYIGRTDAKTSKAKQLKQEWANWFNDLGWYEKNTDDDVLKRAINMKNAFDYANVTSSQEKKDLDIFHKIGMTREEMQGQPRQTDSRGDYAVADEPEEDDGDGILTTKGKIIFGVLAVVGGAAFIAKKIYVDPWLRASGLKR